MSKEIFENPLGSDKISKLLRSYAIPSIAATLVGSLYNIVDQVFIGQGVGYVGNAATNVSYPLSTICLAISLLIGNRERFPFLSLSRAKFSGTSRPDCWKRRLPDGGRRAALSGAGRAFSHTTVEGLWRHPGGSSLCAAICWDHTARNAAPYSDQRDQQFNPRRWKS